MAFIKFSQAEFEESLSSIGLVWRPYRYQYANTLKAGELAYRIDVSQWCQIIVYSTVLPASQKNIEEGISGTSRGEGRDAIRFVIEYRNSLGKIKPVGRYPRLYRRRKKVEDLFADIAWVIQKLHSLARAGLRSRCACGRARPPRYKVHNKSKRVTTEDHWFLGGCLIYGECEFTTTTGARNGKQQKNRPAESRHPPTKDRSLGKGYEAR